MLTAQITNIIDGKHGVPFSTITQEQGNEAVSRLVHHLHGLPNAHEMKTIRVMYRSLGEGEKFDLPDL
jgi:hypothetical protein